MSTTLAELDIPTYLEVLKSQLHIFISFKIYTNKIYQALINGEETNFIIGSGLVTIAPQM